MARRFAPRWVLLLGLLLAPVLIASASLAEQATPVATHRVIDSMEPVPSSEEFRVARATDIFLGRVLGRARDVVLLAPSPLPREIPQPVPTTFYAVEVLDPIKGAATGVVLVRQFQDWNGVASTADGPPLLEIGEEAVFVTWREGRREWYTLEEGPLGHIRVKDAKERDKTVAHFEALLAAVPTPAPLPCSRVTPTPAFSLATLTPFVSSSEGYRFLSPRGENNQIPAASDVFVGRVVDVSPGTPAVEPRPDLPDVTREVPTTLYRVEVLEAVRGGACETVLVRQSGLFDDVYPIQGDGPPLLGAGEMALFVSIRVDAEGWYDLIDGRFGHIRLANDAERATTLARISRYLGTPMTTP